MSVPNSYYTKGMQASALMKRDLHQVHQGNGKRYGEPLVTEKRVEKRTDKDGKVTEKVTEVRVRRSARAVMPSGRARHELWIKRS